MRASARIFFAAGAARVHAPAATRVLHRGRRRGAHRRAHPARRPDAWARPPISERAPDGRLPHGRRPGRLGDRRAGAGSTACRGSSSPTRACSRAARRSIPTSPSWPWPTASPNACGATGRRSRRVPHEHPRFGTRRPGARRRGRALRVRHPRHAQHRAVRRARAVGTVTAVLVTDEQSAGFMADGVSRSSASIGVVNVVPGAGVTHCLSGIAEALLDGIPMVVLACGIRSDTGRAYQLHDIDQAALLRPVTKAVLRPERRRRTSTRRSAAPSTWRAPARPAGGRRDPGRVLPADARRAGAARRRRRRAGADARAAPDGVERAAALLNGANGSLLYVGQRRARRRTRAGRAGREARRAGGHDHPGQGRVPRAPPAVAVERPRRARCRRRCATWPAAATPCSPSACRFSEVGTGSYGFTPPPTVVHVDINPAVFNRNVPATLAIEADAAAFVAALLPLVDDRGQWGEGAEQIANGHRLVHEHVAARARARRA